MEKVIANSKSILCRSGYSTVMDLFHLKKDVFLIPTPGQTEQEYLADHLDNKFPFRKISKVSDLTSRNEMKKENYFKETPDKLSLTIKEL